MDRCHIGGPYWGLLCHPNKFRFRRILIIIICQSTTATDCSSVCCMYTHNQYNTIDGDIQDGWYCRSFDQSQLQFSYSTGTGSHQLEPNTHTEHNHETTTNLVCESHEARRFLLCVVPPTTSNVISFISSELKEFRYSLDVMSQVEAALLITVDDSIKTNILRLQQTTNNRHSNPKNYYHYCYYHRNT